LKKNVQAEVFFLPSDFPAGGQRFCVFHPAAHPRGLVLYLHPFAEEMNKSRRMAAMQARAMAGAGYAVLQIDLLGCGDSSGDFGDASWEAWIDDAALGLKYLRTWAAQALEPNSNDPLLPSARLAELPVWLWGHRAGCLLATDAAKRLNEACNFLFWQPAASGKALLQQFLRLKVAGDLASGQGKAVMDEARRQLAAGEAVEVAGYLLSAGLAAGLERSTLEPPIVAGTPGSLARRLEWIEVSTRDDASLSPVAEKTVALWRAGQFVVRSQIARGPSFWQTQEIEDAPGLITQTLQALQGEAS
jgi:uncharacterized protein